MDILETLYRRLEEIVILSRSDPHNNAGKPQKFSPIFRSSVASLKF